MSSEEQEDYWLTEAGLRIRLALLSHDLVWKAYNEVSYLNFKALGAKELVWTAVMDMRTCDYCQDNHGRKWRVGAFLPFMPAHASCLPGYAHVSPCGQITGATKRAYNGDLIIIQRATGDALPVTPNHPILTPHGWIPARLLNEGGYVVCERRSQSVAPSNGNHQQMPTPIEK